MYSSVLIGPYTSPRKSCVLLAVIDSGRNCIASSVIVNRVAAGHEQARRESLPRRSGVRRVASLASQYIRSLVAVQIAVELNDVIVGYGRRY